MWISLLYDPLEEEFARLELEDYVEKELAKLVAQLSAKLVRQRVSFTQTRIEF